MTRKITIEKGCYRGQLTTVICITLACFMIFMGDKMRVAIYDGLLFSVSTIIPTLFPFFVFSDFWTSAFYINPNGVVSKCFKKLFNVNGCAVTALLSGLICGFPIGVKVATGLYKENKISKNELKKISGFVNNPSAAFVISGVGAGIFKDVRLGLMMYISVIFSSIITGVLFRGKHENIQNTAEIQRQSFNLTNSIINAGINSLNVTSCIIFFSGIIGITSTLIKAESPLTCISIFLEITNAVKMISKSKNLTQLGRLTLTAFALGFSGFSVHLQTFCFLPKEISRAEYILMKLIQGVICALSIFIFNM